MKQKHCKLAEAAPSQMNIRVIFPQLYNLTSQNCPKCNCCQYELVHSIKSLSEVACKPSSSMSSLLNKPLS